MHHKIEVFRQIYFKVILKKLMIIAMIIANKEINLSESWGLYICYRECFSEN